MDAMRWILVLAFGVSLAACGGSKAQPPIVLVVTSTPAATATPPAEGKLTSEAGEFYFDALYGAVTRNESTAFTDLCLTALAALTDPGSSDAEEADATLINELACLPVLRGDTEAAVRGLLQLKD